VAAFPTNKSFIFGQSMNIAFYNLNFFVYIFYEIRMTSV